MFTEEDGTGINNEKNFKQEKMLKYTQFFNLRALGKTSVFKSWDSGITGLRFS